MAEGFAGATAAAMRRLEALMGDERHVVIAAEKIRLAFVGLEIDHREYGEVSDAVSFEYGNPVIEALSAALEADVDRFQLGYVVGQRLAQALAGAFAMGVLAGELHREQTLKREATSE